VHETNTDLDEYEAGSKETNLEEGYSYK